ncbi:hypothetical protein MNBD_GAMMA15-1202 [hydrothermal vent metagenome]|uniref:Uncharacterized protein n=1 Tax=hydrothermal vent metagenome TaxID=652676 RepID=A0A3B0YVT4_9ZZZZ
MRIKILGGLLVILLVLTAGVEASTVSFNPSDTSADIGQTFSINLIGTGFTDIVDGGGVNLFYDASVLAVNSVTVDTTVWDFFDAPGAIDNTSGNVSDVTGF